MESILIVAEVDDVWRIRSRTLRRSAHGNNNSSLAVLRREVSMDHMVDFVFPTFLEVNLIALVIRLTRTRSVSEGRKLKTVHYLASSC
jgi:hypothetical protein